MSPALNACFGLHKNDNISWLEGNAMKHSHLVHLRGSAKTCVVNS